MGYVPPPAPSRHRAARPEGTAIAHGVSGSVQLLRLAFPIVAGYGELIPQAGQ
jgi:hypothetical protein